MICPPLSPEPLVDHWYARHTDHRCLLLHLIGIPPTLLGALLIPVYLFQLSIPIFLFALVSFVGGYLIQFLGHAFEGTDPGEIIYFKRKFGLSYVEFAAGSRGLGQEPRVVPGPAFLRVVREERAHERPVDEAERWGPRSELAAHQLAVSDVSP